MVKDFKLETSFKINDKDKKLYDKYGIPAIELADDGEYLSAIKLLDKILKTNPKVEFALFLKASYLLNHTTQNIEIPDLTLENIEKVKNIGKKIKKELEESIKLLDKVIKLNPKNKNAKDLKDFIKKTPLKQTKDMLMAIKKNVENGADGSCVCPYCNREIAVKGGIQDKEMEIECELCHKKFVCITGVIKVIRGRTTAVVQYGAEPISITLKLTKGLIPINFRTNFRFLVKRGDRVTFFYKKIWLSDNYSDSPQLLYNWDTGEFFRL